VSVPVEIVNIATTDPELVRHTIQQLYTPGHPMRLATSRGPSPLRLRELAVGPLNVGYVRQDMLLRIEAAPFGRFIAQSVLAGRLRYESAGEVCALATGDVVRLPATEALDSSFVDQEVEQVTLPLAVIERVAREQTELGPAGLVFFGMTPRTPELGAVWRRMSDYLRHLVADDAGLLDTPLVARHLVETVAAAALEVFPNNAIVAHYDPGTGWVAPAAMRRATDYIDEHVAEPITGAEIARAAGLSARSLQAGFRTYYDTTLSDYLQRVRLERAHQELRSGGPAGSSVAAIAGRWGYVSVAMFEDHYRRRFGVSPSDTLRG
jgi:AraC-like DNA-binding protein